MKSWWNVPGPGGGSVELRDMPLPQPGPNEVRVKVHAASLNRGEFLVSPSYGHVAAEARPAGSDAAGVVDALGEGAGDWKIGDRIMGPSRGAYGEYAIMDQRLATPAPQNLSFEECAAIPITFSTTYDMLWNNARMRAGEWLLVTGISSGVGVACLLAAKKVIGGRVIGTSGSREKLARLSALGLDLAIETRAPDFAARVMEATGGKGADVVVNNVGGTVFEECVRCMNYHGRLATVGYLDRTFQAKIDLNALHARRLHLFGVSARLRPPEERVENVRGFRRDLLPAFADGRMRPLVDRVFPLAEFPQAKAFMESNAQVGKIVLKVV